MKTQLVITDLTRMQSGRVCIAGYNSQRKCIRPVAPTGGIPESILFQNDQNIIFPFALVEIDLLEERPEPPHTEDMVFHLYSPHLIREVHGREEVLAWSLFDGVEAIFDQPVLSGPGFYVMDCTGPRSLGTILPAEIQQIIYEPGEEGTWDYRLLFVDQHEKIYRLKINDLTWHLYCNSIRGVDRNPHQIADELNERLKKSKVYLRVGLARGWKKFPERCYLQITGIYSFPDYAEGQSFSELWFKYSPYQLNQTTE